MSNTKTETHEQYPCTLVTKTDPELLSYIAAGHITLIVFNISTHYAAVYSGCGISRILGSCPYCPARKASSQRERAASSRLPDVEPIELLRHDGCALSAESANALDTSITLPPTLRDLSLSSTFVCLLKVSSRESIAGSAASAFPPDTIFLLQQHPHKRLNMGPRSPKTNGNSSTNPSTSTTSSSVVTASSV